MCSVDIQPCVLHTYNRWPNTLFHSCFFFLSSQPIQLTSSSLTALTWQWRERSGRLRQRLRCCPTPTGTTTSRTTAAVASTVSTCGPTPMACGTICRVTMYTRQFAKFNVSVCVCMCVLGDGYTLCIISNLLYMCTSCIASAFWRRPNFRTTYVYVYCSFAVTCAYVCGFHVCLRKLKM